MSFDFRLFISGICAFVPNTNPSSASADRICVVMPGGGGISQALDGEPLCPHQSSIEGMPGSAISLSKQPLNGMRVSIGMDPIDTTINPPVILPAPISLPAPVSASVELPDVAKLLGSFGTPSAGIVSLASPPRPAVVNTQVMLQYGTLTMNYYDSTLWNIDALDGGVPYSGIVLPHELELYCSGLNSLKVNLDAFDGTSSVPLDLTPPGALGTVAIIIVNDCNNGSMGGSAPRDRDFKWYYELLTTPGKQQIVTEIGSGDLPFPRHAPFAVGGQNCFSTRFPGIGF
jgi:hypothetical protein